MNVEWNKVTWYSLTLAVIVAVLIFGLALYLGYKTGASSVGPSLITQGATVPAKISSDSVSIGYNAESKEVEVMTGGVTQAKLILIAPPRTSVVSQGMSPEGRYVFFTLATNNSYMDAKNMSGYGSDNTIAYKYDVEGSAAPEALFTGYELTERYALVKAVGAGGTFVAYSLHQCYQCDAPGISTIVVNTDAVRNNPEGSIKDIGHVTNFSFTGRSTYKYFDAISEGLGVSAGAAHEGAF